MKFETLTPKKDLDNIEAYEKAINFAVESDEIKNVAITGIYGSGKTSVIESYKNNHNYKFIHISLANFQKTGEQSDFEKNKTQSESKLIAEDKTLEGKILNQLLHQINPSKIPQTIFRVKKDSPKHIAYLWGIAVSILMLLITYLWKFKEWEEFIKNSTLSSQGVLEIIEVFAKFTITFEARIIAASIVFISFMIFLILIIHKQLNRKLLKSFSFKGSKIQTDIEIFGESKDSYFDKYLDDVIYLFNHAGSEIFVFEDIDRFDNNIIFAKLKEINTIVNNHREIKNKKWSPSNMWNKERKVTFLYLLKDDMFESKERTKFFDFIIPIVPVVNASNSYDILASMLNKEDQFKNFDKYFLQNLSLYIDDMRLLKNIYNEFIIYKETLKVESEETLKNNSFLGYEKLLAMVAYKNIFPSDFSELQQEKGFIFEVFDQKKKFIQNEHDILSFRLEELTQIVEIANKELLASIDELYALYLPSTIGEWYGFSVDNATEDKFDTKADFVKALRESPENVYARRRHYSSEKYSLSQEFIDIETNPSFIARKENIINNNETKSTELLILIKNTDREIAELESKKLSEFLNRDHLEELKMNHFINEEDNFELIKGSEYFDLLVYLLRNGYIDEGYEDYLTYFYEQSISLSDKKYLRSIVDERKLDWSFSLDKISEVLDRVQPNSFLVEASLNFNMLRYILALDKKEKIEESLTNLFYTLEKSKNIEFLIKAFDQFESVIQTKFIEEWYINAPSLFNELLISNSTSDDKAKIILSVLENLTLEQIKTINSKNILSKFIEKSKKLLMKVDGIGENLQHNLKGLEVKFSNVPFENIKTDLTNFLYENYLFKINKENLDGFIKYIHHVEDEYNLKHQNYTIISSFDNSPLIKYVNNNIQEYMDEYLVFSEGETFDDVTSIYKLLNNNEITLQDRKSYIKTINHAKMDITKIKDSELKMDFIEQNKVTPNEVNIMEYFIFQGSEWDVHLIDFVNQNESNLLFGENGLKDILNEETKKLFFDETIKEFALSDVAYEKILTALDYRYVDDFKIESIPEDKMLILINKNIISFGEDNLISLRSLYPLQVVNYITRHLESYLTIVDSESIYDYDELVAVLNTLCDEKISVTRRIVNAIREPISVKDNNYNSRLLNYILVNRFKGTDLEYLVSRFDGYSSTTKDIIQKLFIEHIQVIVAEEIKPDLALLTQILNQGNVDLETRKLLFSRNIAKFKKNGLKEILEVLSLSKYIEVVNENKRKVEFEINEINTNILNYLHDIELIASFQEVGSNYQVNSKTKLNLI